MMSHLNLNLNTPNDITRYVGIHYIDVGILSRQVVGNLQVKFDFKNFLTLLCVLYQADNFFTDSRGTRFLNCFYTSEIGGSWKKQQNKYLGSIQKCSPNG